MTKTKADVSKEKTKRARQDNAEKQKRYRESMKAQGYRARLVWEKPLSSGQIRTAAPVIREASLSIVRSNPAIREVMENICETFKMDCEKQEIPQKVWKPVYQDIQVLLKPFLDVI
jgi:predicted secreted protein